MIKQEFVLKKIGDTLRAKEWNNFTAYVNLAIDEINSNKSIISPDNENNIEVKSNKNISFLLNGEENNKIKLSHGEVEFGSLNPEEVLIHSNKYSFKKDGIINIADESEENSSASKHITWEELIDVIRKIKDSDFTYDQILEVIDVIRNSNNITLEKNLITLNDYLVKGYTAIGQSDITYSMTISDFEHYLDSFSPFVFYLDSLTSDEILIPDSFKSIELLNILDTVFSKAYILSCIREIGELSIKSLIAFKFSDIVLFYTNYSHKSVELNTPSNDSVFLTDILDTTKYFKTYDIDKFLFRIYPNLNLNVSLKLDLYDLCELSGPYNETIINSLIGNNPIYDVGYTDISDFESRRFDSIIDKFNYYRSELEDDEFELIDGLIDPSTMITNLSAIKEAKIKTRFAVKCLDRNDNFKYFIITYIPTDICIEDHSRESTVLLSDIAKLVNYMKTNNQGPWANI